MTVIHFISLNKKYGILPTTTTTTTTNQFYGMFSK